MLRTDGLHYRDGDGLTMLFTGSNVRFPGSGFVWLFFWYLHGYFQLSGQNTEWGFEKPNHTRPLNPFLFDTLSRLELKLEADKHFGYPDTAHRLESLSETVEGRQEA